MKHKIAKSRFLLLNLAPCIAPPDDDEESNGSEEAFSDMDGDLAIENIESQLKSQFRGSSGRGHGNPSSPTSSSLSSSSASKSSSSSSQARRRGQESGGAASPVTSQASWNSSHINPDSKGCQTLFKPQIIKHVRDLLCDHIEGNRNHIARIAIAHRHDRALAKKNHSPGCYYAVFIEFQDNAYAGSHEPFNFRTDWDQDGQKFSNSRLARTFGEDDEDHEDEAFGEADPFSNILPTTFENKPAPAAFLAFDVTFHDIGKGKKAEAAMSNFVQDMETRQRAQKTEQPSTKPIFYHWVRDSANGSKWISFRHNLAKHQTLINSVTQAEVIKTLFEQNPESCIQQGALQTKVRNVVQIRRAFEEHSAKEAPPKFDYNIPAHLEAYITEHADVVETIKLRDACTDVIEEAEAAITSMKDTLITQYFAKIDKLTLGIEQNLERLKVVHEAMQADPDAVPEMQQRVDEMVAKHTKSSQDLSKTIMQLRRILQESFQSISNKGLANIPSEHSLLPGGTSLPDNFHILVKTVKTYRQSIKVVIEALRQTILEKTEARPPLPDAGVDEGIELMINFIMKLKDWIENDAKPNKVRRRGLIIYSARRGVGKTTLAQAIAGGEGHFVQVSTRFTESRLFELSPTRTSTIILDDVAFNLRNKTEYEMAKKLFTGQSCVIVDKYLQLEWPGGVPCILTTNDTQMFGELLASKDFKFDMVFLEVPSFLGPRNVESQARRPVTKAVSSHNLWAQYQEQADHLEKAEMTTLKPLSGDRPMRNYREDSRSESEEEDDDDGLGDLAGLDKRIFGDLADLGAGDSEGFTEFII